MAEISEGSDKGLPMPSMNYLFMASGGILREINNLTVDALLKATNQSKRKIDEKLIHLVASERDSA